MRYSAGSKLFVNCSSSALAAIFIASLVQARDSSTTTVSYWVGPAVGNWMTASNWSPVGVPSNSGKNLFDVVIDPEPGIPSTVTLTGGVQVQLMWVTAGDTLQLSNASLLALAGAHTTIDGALNMQSVGNGTTLRIDGDVLVGGSGVLGASNNLANYVHGSDGASRLTVANTLTILGSMQLGYNQMKLTNHGLIETNSNQGMYVDLTDAGPNYNDGTMRASNGASMTIFTAGLDNTEGLIEAAVGSFVKLSGSTITGGTLRDADGDGAGAVQNVGTAVLVDTTIEGAFSCQNATTTYLNTGINLQGPMRMNSVGNGTSVIIQTSPLVLGGPGGIVGSNTLANIVHGASSDHRLVVPPEGQILGSMQLGYNQMKLTNHGLIETNSNQGMYVDLTDAGPNYNDGTMRASNGASMTIFTAGLDNTDGLIEAAAGSFVKLSGSTITGGTLRDADGDGAGAVQNVGTAVLVDTTIEGAFSCQNATTTYLYTGINLQGPMRMNSVGNGTNVIIQTSPLVLGGPGGIVGSNTLANIVHGASSDHRLVVPPEGQILGSMQLGYNQMKLTNHGLIETNSNQGMYVDLTDAGPNFNDGTMRASSGASMTIYAAGIDNTDGLIEAAAGSFVKLSGSTITGGTLRDADGDGAGAVQNVGTAVLVDTTIEGAFSCQNATTTYLYTGINLQGPMRMNSVGNGTNLVVQTSPFVLSGPSGVVCSNTLANFITGVHADNLIVIGQDSVLSGSCQFGLNTVGLRNEGSLLVNSSAGMYVDPADVLGFTNAGFVSVSGGQLSLYAGAFVNEGQVVVEAGRLLWRQGEYLQTSGSTTVKGTLQSTSQVNLMGGSLGGTGVVNAIVSNNGGTVAPGASAGTLTLAQGYTQAAAGNMAIEIGGAAPGTEHDRLAVTGNAALSGTLTLSRIGGFVPTNGQSFVILTCTGTRTGTFDTIASCDPVNVTYGTQSVTVEYVGSFEKVGDLNHDGLVNGADLGILLGSWGNCAEACCQGDLNGDSVVNGADLGILLGDWS
jgi:fibronectin-binding autotransporter adhesin